MFCSFTSQQRLNFSKMEKFITLRGRREELPEGFASSPSLRSGSSQIGSETIPSRRKKIPRIWGIFFLQRGRRDLKVVLESQRVSAPLKAGRKRRSGGGFIHPPPHIKNKDAPCGAFLFLTRATGFEPVISSVTGKRLKPGWTTPACVFMPAAGIEPAT